MIMTGKPRLFLADEHTLLCELVAGALEDQFEIVGIEQDGPSALQGIRRTSPDVAILAVYLPELNGIEVAQRVMKPCRVIFLTAAEDSGIIARALAVRGASLLLKSSSASELPMAVWSALRGRRYITPLVKDMIENGECDCPENVDLTPRQREVIQLLAEGKQMKQAAAMLHVSIRTIAFHKYGVMRKLQLRSSADLVRLAVSQHLVGN